MRRRAGADALGVDVATARSADAAAAASDAPSTLRTCRARGITRARPGLDRDDLLGALEPFTDDFERADRVGSVNGRLVPDNVSLGIYGEADRQRGVIAAAKAANPPSPDGARTSLGAARAAPTLRLVDDEGRRAPQYGCRAG